MQDTPLNPSFIVPSCPFCGASPEFRQWSEYLGRDTLRVKSPKHKWIGSHVFPLICIQCGYVQDFVVPEDFRT